MAVASLGIRDGTSQLRLEPGERGAVYTAHGYASPGDGGGGQWVWDESSTANDNGGTLLKVAGVTTGRWKRVHDGVINLKWFGAKGDGTEDITDALNRAIEAAAFYSTAKQPATVYIPNGTYALEGPLVYEGRGEAFNLIGEQGGLLAHGGTKLKWMGDSGATMLTLGGVWRGRVEDIDFDGNSLAETCLWFNSIQPSEGAGSQGYEFRRLGLYDVNPEATDPVVFRVGHPSGGTYQVDLSIFEHLQLRGSIEAPEAVALWRAEQGGNTCNFMFRDSSFTFGRHGIDALNGSGTLGVDNCFFGAISDADDGSDSACLRVSGAVRASVRNANCENNEGYVARFIDCGTMGASADNGLVVESCLVEMESTDDHGVIRYFGPLTLKNNGFAGAVTNITTVTPRIICSPLLIGVDGAPGQAPGAITSEGNTYGYMASGDYAPFYDDQGNRVTGPDSYGGSGFYGFQRTQVFSRGDNATKAGGSVAIALEPWDGSIARDIKTWDPGSIADGATLTTTHTWSVTGVLANAPVIGVSFSTLLPAGMSLTCGQSDTNEVWATLTNNTGDVVDLDSGTLTFTARRA